MRSLAPCTWHQVCYRIHARASPLLDRLGENVGEPLPVGERVDANVLELGEEGDAVGGEEGEKVAQGLRAHLGVQVRDALRGEQGLKRRALERRHLRRTEASPQKLRKFESIV